MFSNGNLLTDIRKSRHGILLNGVQADVESVRVDLEGDFGEVGPVYFSRGAAANILSFAAMVDRGAKIQYDQQAERFTLQPKGSSSIYSFCRRPVPGSSGRFYVCDVNTMIKPVPTQHLLIDELLLHAVNLPIMNFLSFNLRADSLVSFSS